MFVRRSIFFKKSLFHKEVEMQRRCWKNTMIKQNNNLLIQKQRWLLTEEHSSWSKQEFVQSNFILTSLTQHCYSLGGQSTRRPTQHCCWFGQTLSPLIEMQSTKDTIIRATHTHTRRISGARYLESILSVNGIVVKVLQWGV